MVGLLRIQSFHYRIHPVLKVLSWFSRETKRAKSDLYGLGPVLKVLQPVRVFAWAEWILSRREPI